MHCKVSLEKLFSFLFYDFPLLLKKDRQFIDWKPSPLRVLKYFFLVYTGDKILSATVYFDNMLYEDAIQILEHAQAYKVKLCLKRKPDIKETDPIIKSDVIPVTILKLSAQSLYDSYCSLRT